MGCGTEEDCETLLYNGCTERRMGSTVTGYAYHGLCIRYNCDRSLTYIICLDGVKKGVRAYMYIHRRGTDHPVIIMMMTILYDREKHNIGLLMKGSLPSSTLTNQCRDFDVCLCVYLSAQLHNVLRWRTDS